MIQPIPCKIDVAVSWNLSAILVSPSSVLSKIMDIMNSILCEGLTIFDFFADEYLIEISPGVAQIGQKVVKC